MSKKLDRYTSPLTYRTIDNMNVKKNLAEKLKRADYHNKYFRRGGNNVMPIRKNDKMVVPTIFQKYIVN